MTLSERYKNRTLRVDILIIFLFLIGLSSILIIWFTYSRSSKSIMEFSRGEMHRTSASIIERIEDLFDTNAHIANDAISLVPAPQYFSFDDERLQAYMISTVTTYPMIYGIFYANPQGDFIEVLNLKASKQTHFVSDPSKALPKGSVFAYRIIKDGDYETWTYKNEKLETLAKESITPVSNAHLRSWFKEAPKSKDVYWSPPHPIMPSNEPAITCAKAGFSEDGTLIAIAGLDLSLDVLSNFLSAQKIGKTGKAYILDKDGHVLVPENVPTKVPDAGFSAYKLNPQRDFTFEKDRVEYLTCVHPLNFSKVLGLFLIIAVPVDDFFEDLFKTQREVVLISIGILILSAFFIVYFSKQLSVPIVVLADETDKLRHLNFGSEHRVDSNIREIKLMDSAISSLRVAIRSFGRYIPKEIVKQLLKKEKLITLGGEKREVAILFSDIEGFTGIADAHPPEEIMPLLTEYLDALSKAILENQGIIDKFMGDGIMAIWGAPLDNPESGIDACLAALYCQHCVTQLNEKFEAENKPVFHTRIGIEIGEVIAGNVGTTERMNYTVIGEAVNIASRLQSTNKIYHTKILISEYLNEKTEGRFLTRPIDVTELRGKKIKIKIYELMGALEGPEEILATPQQIELKKLFTEAYEAYYRHDRETAKALFLALQMKFPRDYPTQIYLERLKNEAHS